MSTSPPDLAHRLTLIVDALSRAAAARAAKHWAAAPVVVLLWAYLRRLAKRFEALAGRLGAGQIPAGRSVQPATVRPSCARRRALPHGFAWLLRLVPEAVHLRGQLQHWLADPELVALLEVAPEAGRILRPLCRMLGFGPGPDVPPALFRQRVAPASPVPPWPPSRPDHSESIEVAAVLPPLLPAPA